MNDFHHRAHPDARSLVLEVLSRYPLGMSMTELRRRTSRGGLVIAARVHEEFSTVLETLLDAGDVEQRVIGRGVRYVRSESTEGEPA